VPILQKGGFTAPISQADALAPLWINVGQPHRWNPEEPDRGGTFTLRVADPLGVEPASIHTLGVIRRFDVTEVTDKGKPLSHPDHRIGHSV
jgi:hypothetical protein